jgi:hypothetical protein
MSFVLLCCVKPFVKSDLINEALISEAIRPYGNIQAINIFHREALVKSFIQVDNEESIQEVINNLNNKSFPWGKVKVFQSYKKNIFGSSHISHFQSPINNSSPFQNMAKINSKEDICPSQHRVSDSQFDPLSDLSSEIQIRKSKGNLSTNSDLRNNISHYNNDNSNNVFSKNFQTSNEFNKASEKGKSRILILTNYNISIMNGKIMANFFGCFGNVIRIAANQSSKEAYIEFDYFLGASRSLDNLQNFKIFNSFVCLRLADEKFNLDDYIKSFSGKLILTNTLVKFYRFKKGLNIKLNPPSNILHVTGIDPNATEQFLYILISLIQEPRTIYLLCQRSRGSKMYLVEFTDVFQAAEVLSVLHNKQVGTKLLKVSYSHTNIEDLL